MVIFDRYVKLPEGNTKYPQCLGPQFINRSNRLNRLDPIYPILKVEFYDSKVLLNLREKGLLTNYQSNRSIKVMCAGYVVVATLSHLISPRYEINWEFFHANIQSWMGLYTI